MHQLPGLSRPAASAVGPAHVTLGPFIHARCKAGNLAEMGQQALVWNGLEGPACLVQLPCEGERPGSVQAGTA